MSADVKALLAIKSTERCDALAALLESLNQIDVIYESGSQQATRDFLEVHRPALILIDFEFFDAVQRDNCAEVAIVLVINRTEQAQAHVNGATQVFIEGTPVNQLVSIIEQQLRDARDAM